MTVENLLDDAVVAPFLCNTHPHEVIAQDTAELREKVYIVPLVICSP